MTKKMYQVTLYCTTGEYRPVSCIVAQDVEELERIGEKAFKDKIKAHGITEICAKRNWVKADLLRYHYLKMKIREYDSEKIKEEKKVLYQKAIEKRQSEKKNKE